MKNFRPVNTDPKLDQIRADLLAGMQQKQLAAKYQKSKSAISGIAWRLRKACSKPILGQPSKPRLPKGCI